MLLTISILALAYLVMGKDIEPMMEKLGSIDWRTKINDLIDKMRPWALKAGRAATRPLLQFYYVMNDTTLSTLDRALIYAAIAYTIIPHDLLPRSVFKLLGVLDDGIAVTYVYNRVRKHITPQVNAKVDERLNDWFGVEYEIVN